MKLLIVTQKIDKKDPILGFFHRWVEEFAKHFDKVTVICLEKGEYSLPENVKVLSLGKEARRSRLQYVSRFYQYILAEKTNYDTVFVHMNQEYVLLGGILWRIMGKRIFFWRLHPLGSWLTDVACALSHAIFSSSEKAFVAKNKKTVRVPVGVDLEKFRPVSLPVESNKILVLGRIAPIKRIIEIARGLGVLDKKEVVFEADIIGDALPQDKSYEEAIAREIRELGLSKKVRMLPAVSPDEASEVYKRYKLFINLTPDGSLDKTIIEALSSGLRVVVSNAHFKGILPENWVISEPENPQTLAHQLKLVLSDSHSRNTEAQNRIAEFIEGHRLEKVILRLAEEMKTTSK